MAGGFLARAYAGLMAKLARIPDASWREAYANIALHRRIVADRDARAGSVPPA
jgi:hypothetical protein